jgi:hypothetical protein
MLYIFFLTRLREETIWDLPVLYAMDYDLRAIATLVIFKPRFNFKSYNSNE